MQTMKLILIKMDDICDYYETGYYPIEVDNSVSGKTC
jgi:hypothetical protein